MPTNQSTPRTVDQYIARFPPEVQAIMETIRATIREAAPGVEETISYQMPAFTLNGHALAHIAAYKKHIGLYPAPNGVAQFEDALAAYGSGKSTLKFLLDQPIPFELIREIVKVRAAENAGKPSKAPARKA